MVEVAASVRDRMNEVRSSVIVISSGSSRECAFGKMHALFEDGKLFFILWSHHKGCPHIHKTPQKGSTARVYPETRAKLRKF